MKLNVPYNAAAVEESTSTRSATTSSVRERTSCTNRNVNAPKSR